MPNPNVLPTKLRRLKVKRVDLVDRGANPGAHVMLFKREGDMADPEGTDEQTIEALVSSLETSIAKGSRKISVGRLARLKHAVELLDGSALKEVRRLLKELVDEVEENMPDIKKVDGELLKMEDVEKRITDAVAAATAAFTTQQTELQKKLEATDADLKKAREDVAKAQADVKKAEDEKLIAQFTEIAKSLGDAGAKAEDAAIFKAVAEVSPEAWTRVKELLTAAGAQIKAGGLFDQKGSDRREGVQGTAVDKATTLAQAEIVKAATTPPMSMSDALSKVFADNPALYSQYAQETAVKV